MFKLIMKWKGGSRSMHYAVTVSPHSSSRSWHVPWARVILLSMLLLHYAAAQRVSPMAFFSGQGVSPNTREARILPDQTSRAPACDSAEAGRQGDSPSYQNSECISSQQTWAEDSTKVERPAAETNVNLENFTEVFVSVLLNKLLVVDEQKYQFEAVFHLRLSWTDPRAKGEIERRTAETFGQGKQELCERLCGGGLGRPLCCDTVWLPGLHATNIVGMPEEGSDAEIIGVVPTNLTHVIWKRRVHSTFHSPLFFQRFPFDRQRLLMEFLATGCCYYFTPSSVGMRTAYNSPFHLTEKLPTQISSWKTQGVSISSHPYSMETAVVWNQEAHPDEKFNLRMDFAGAGENFKSLNSSFAVIIEIHRLWFYYVFMIFSPIFLTVLLSWATLCVTPEYLELRIATSITLFLALTSERGVIFDALPHSNYVTIMGCVIVWSYILIVATVFQSLLVSYVYSVSSKVEEEKKLNAFEAAAQKLTMVQQQLSQRELRKGGRENPFTGYMRGPLTPGPWILSHGTPPVPPHASPKLEPLSSSVSKSSVGSHAGSHQETSPKLVGESASQRHNPSPVLTSLRFPLSIPGKVLSVVSSTLVGRDLNPFRSASSSSAGPISRDASLAEEEPLLPQAQEQSAATKDGILSQENALVHRDTAPGSTAVSDMTGTHAASAAPSNAGENSASSRLGGDEKTAGDLNPAAEKEEESSRETDLVLVQSQTSSEVQTETRREKGKSTLSPAIHSTTLRVRRKASRVPSKGKMKGLSESSRLELPQLQDISRDPSRAKIFISKLDAYCLVIFPVIYIAGLLYLYIAID